MISTFKYISEQSFCDIEQVKFLFSTSISGKYFLRDSKTVALFFFLQNLKASMNIKAHNTIAIDRKTSLHDDNIMLFREMIDFSYRK